MKAQEYLDKYYPKSQRNKVEKLEIKYGNNAEGYLWLEGYLDLSGFANLEYLNVEANKLTSLNLSECFKLKKL